MTKLKETITKKLDVLPDNDLHQVLAFVEFLEWKTEKQDRPEKRAAMVSVERDPLVGLFEGPSDLATRSEELLEQSL